MSQISEQRREQIVQSARRIVDEQGPRHLTAEAITQQVGVSRPLLYHYFENMNALLDTIVAIYLDEFAETIAAWEATLPPNDADRAGDAWAVSLVGAIRGPLVTDCPLLRDGDAATDRPATAAAIDPSYPAFLDRCVQILIERVLEGDAPALDACRTAERPEAAMFHAVHGLAATLRRFPDLTDEEAGRLFAAPWNRPAAPNEPPAPAQPDEPAAPADGPAAKGGAAGKTVEQPAPAKKGLFGWIFS